MRIVGGSDVHRRQITFDYLDEGSGQSRRGRIAPADRMLLRRWLEASLSARLLTPAASVCLACDSGSGMRVATAECFGVPRLRSDGGGHDERSDAGRSG